MSSEHHNEPGGAGSGKTYSLLLECLRHKDVPQFYTLFLRRTKAELRHPGGPWDESFNIFGMFPEATASGSVMKWEFGDRRPAKVQFSGIELEKDLEDYKGSQVPLMVSGFRKKFLSNNRMNSGKPFRGNPEPSLMSA